MLKKNKALKKKANTWEEKQKKQDLISFKLGGGALTFL
jgi:hypothetical protein